MSGAAPRQGSYRGEFAAPVLGGFVLSLFQLGLASWRHITEAGLLCFIAMIGVVLYALRSGNFKAVLVGAAVALPLVLVTQWPALRHLWRALSSSLSTGGFSNLPLASLLAPPIIYFAALILLRSWRLTRNQDAPPAAPDNAPSPPSGGSV